MELKMLSNSTKVNNKQWVENVAKVFAFVHFPHTHFASNADESYIYRQQWHRDGVSWSIVHIIFRFSLTVSDAVQTVETKNAPKNVYFSNEPKM
jgi:hypothetical protein